MKKLLYLILLSIVLMIVIGPTSEADDYYDIRHYDVKIVVDNDNNYHITETIDVEFYSPRHGIYRDIPTVFRDQNHGIKKIKVIDPTTGKKYAKNITKSNGVTSIRIGDEDIYVDGRMTYAISYTYMGGMDYDTTMDEFYFNIIGDEWDATIDQVTFEVDMPNTFDVTSLNLTSGGYGSTDNTNVQYEVNGSKITGTTIAPLYREFITVALPLEEGYYTGVDASLNLVGLILFILIFIGIAIFAFYKNHQLRNENMIVPVISFEPPKGLNAAEVAYIYGREAFSNSDLSTLVLSWASLGCLTIEEKKKKLLGSYMIFTKLKDLPDYIAKYEIRLFNAMFQLGSDGVVSTEDMENVYYSSLNTAASSLRVKFTKEQEILVNKTQWLSKFYAFLYVLLYSIGFALVVDQLIHTGFFVNFLPIFIISVIAFIALSILATVFKSGSSFVKVLIASILGTLLLGLGVIVYALNYGRFLEILTWQSAPILLVLVILNVSVLLGIWFMVTSKEYTEYAKVALGQIEGFREFLKTAKTDQMEVLHKNNPAYVYDILPFAMVLGLTNIWEKYVTKLSVESPSWYYSTTSFTAANMTRSMSGSFKTASSQPSSSGSGGSSSGGGFSGGGGGGGGGGSW